MAAPWLKYQDAAPTGKPWEKYGGVQQPAAADFSDVRSRADTLPQGYGTLARNLKLGTRSVLEGAASIPDLFGMPLYAASRAMGVRPTTFTDLATAASDKMGFPTAATPDERIARDVSRAGTGAAVTMGAGAALGPLSKIGQFLTANPKLQAVSATTGATAGGLTRESGGSERQQLLAGLLGGLAPGAIPAGMAGLTRLLVRGGEAGRKAMQSTIDDFSAVGAQPSAGQAAGNWRMRGVESLLAGGPTSGGVMVNAAEREAADIGRGLQARADAFIPNASAERAGRAVERGIDTFVGRVKETRAGLYAHADSLIPPTATLPLTRTQQTLEQLTTPTIGAESTTAAMVNPKIARLAQTVGEDLLAARASGAGGLPYAAVKEVRSRIGQELSDFSLTTDKPTAEYKRLYAALSQDMEEAAAQHGPAAAQAVKRANAYYKASQGRIEQLQRVVDKAGGPEKVYAAVMSGTRDGGTTLRAVMQSLPHDGQRALTGAVIKRMGLATPGAQDATGEIFSAKTFLTNWNNVSKEAKSALFVRHGPQFVEDMDKIARVAQNIQSGSKVFANPSGTANRAAAWTYGTALLGTLFTGNIGAFSAAVGGGIGTNVLAHAFTSPRVVSWLAKQTTLPAGSRAAQLAVLAQIGQQDPAAAELHQALTEKK